NDKQIHRHAEKYVRYDKSKVLSNVHAGRGIKGCMVYGETYEFGHKSVLNPVSPNDYHATLLHLFGLDHTKLVYFHNGQEDHITDSKPCRVVKEILKDA